MSVARAGFLPDLNKLCILSIDSFDNRLLKGQVFHESLDHGQVFGSLLEMIHLLEGLFDRQHYPMKSVDQRFFGKIPPKARRAYTGGGKKWEEDLGNGEIFRLRVKYRYHATWQGEIKNLGHGKTYDFLSFLELMEYFNRELGSNTTRTFYGLGKGMGRTARNKERDFTLSGHISYPAAKQRFFFANEFDIREAMEYWMDPLPSGIFIVSSLHMVPATFGVRVFFRRNSTWQGTIFWIENGGKVNFRSFYEMLLLMQEGALGSRERKEIRDSDRAEREAGY